jgi:hypothetical protein
MWEREKLTWMSMRLSFPLSEGGYNPLDALSTFEVRVDSHGRPSTCYEFHPWTPQVAYD